MYSPLRQLLFALPPETAHHLTLDGLGCAERLGLLRFVNRGLPSRPVEVMGLRFPNRVGLAAGLDKNGDYFNALGALGFGFVEIGTVTPRPQLGNPKPRLFRLPRERAIINRMGFNNKGVDYLVEEVAGRRYSGVLGINIGKNRDTPVEQAVADYRRGMAKVYGVADYITVNISSPNTPGLRDLQFGDHLADLLASLKEQQGDLAREHDRYVPLAIKIAPDMTDDEIRQTAEALVSAGVDGVIATNTTVSRKGVTGEPFAQEQGGLSGEPLRQRATEVVAVLAEALAGALPIIGVGGIGSGRDALDKLEAGASLVQVYTGFIYGGPKLVREIVEMVADWDSAGA